MQPLAHFAAASAVALLFTGAQAPPVKNINPASAPVKQASAKLPMPAPVPQIVTVTVESGDSLSTIAAGNNTTWQRIYDANTSISNPDLIYPGETLVIPGASEQLADRALPTPPAIETTSTTSSSASQVATPAVAMETSTPQPTTASGSVWDELAACESGDNWAINTGNGFYGGLQFTLSSWQAVGGTGLPSNASREEQIYRAGLLQSRQGWGAWPVCSVKVGLR